MNPRIFISYRRDDSLQEARSILSELQRQFDADGVFMDERSIQGGDDWPGEIQDALRAATIVLVLIQNKRDWLGVDDEGNRRIDDEQDWVCQEVALALREKIVIPVLLGDDADMPSVDGLPNELKSLSEKQVMPLRSASWVNDLESLVRRLSSIAEASVADEPTEDSDQADLCEALLRDYNQKCLADWEGDRPLRFVEPYLAIRKDEHLLDRSEIDREDQTGDSKRTAHVPLLTDEEKQNTGPETAVQQYQRLFQQRSQSAQGARICVTEDAGAGKSVFTHHLRAVLASAGGQAEFFGGKPGLVVRWEGREETWPFDLQRGLEECVAATCASHQVTPKQVAEYALKQRRVCVILDALDQVTDVLKSWAALAKAL